jgi:integrase
LQINETYILFRQKKTGKIAAPALNPIAKMIIMRNSVVDIEDGKRRLTPHRRVVQTINRRIKAIAKEHGIKKNLSTHVGRHSFAMLLSDMGIPEGIRAIQLGHNPMGNTQKYGRSSDYEFASRLVLRGFQRAIESKATTYEEWLMDINPTFKDVYSKAI